MGIKYVFTAAYNCLLSSIKIQLHESIAAEEFHSTIIVTYDHLHGVEVFEKIPLYRVFIDLICFEVQSFQGSVPVGIRNDPVKDFVPQNFLVTYLTASKLLCNSHQNIPLPSIQIPCLHIIRIKLTTHSSKLHSTGKCLILRELFGEDVAELIWVLVEEFFSEDGGGFQTFLESEDVPAVVFEFEEDEVGGYL